MAFVYRFFGLAMFYSDFGPTIKVQRFQASEVPMCFHASHTSFRSAGRTKCSLILSFRTARTALRSSDCVTKIEPKGQMFIAFMHAKLPKRRKYCVVMHSRLPKRQRSFVVPQSRLANCKSIVFIHSKLPKRQRWCCLSFCDQDRPQSPRSTALSCVPSFINTQSIVLSKMMFL